MKNYFYLFVILVIISSCVPKRLLLTSEKRVHDLQADSSGTHSKLNDCNSNLSSTNSKLADTNSKLNDCNSQLANCNAALKNTGTSRDSLQNALQDLSNSANEKITSSQATINEQAKKLKEMQTMIQAQKDVMNKLRKTIADALVDFKPDELTVSIKDGKVYVSLQEKLLFKSGSDVVNPKGKEALKSVADVLNKNPDINIDVEGYTDSIPIHDKFEDNWALSVARATSVIRILTTDYKVDAHKVTASGRAEFFPVASNQTADGRAHNRRTEIILSPNLTELFKLLGQ
jgi:chemotaxis protein MotB